jgi:DNA modification methylase
MTDLDECTGVAKNQAKWSVYKGDSYSVLQRLVSNSYDCAITSPPYFWLRDYGVENQLGQEKAVEEYVQAIARVMDEIFRVLKPEGVLFLNLGDTYYSGKGESHGTDKKSSKRRFGLRAVDRSGGLDIGIRPKSAIGIPWRVAIELSKRNWVLRSPIIWHRKHCLPEAVRDRPRRSYENLFMLVKSRKYYFNRQALIDCGEEDMWTIAARPKTTPGIDTAPFPDELVERCISIGCPPGGAVIDPFAGGGTTLRVSIQLDRDATGIDLNPDFCAYMAKTLQEL